VCDRLHELYRIAFAVGRDVVRQAQEDGRLADDLGPFAVAVLFSALLNGLLLTWLVDQEQVDAENLIWGTPSARKSITGLAGQFLVATRVRGGTRIAG
jgi:BetI-type transcriptional repressor, C-terminal